MSSKLVKIIILFGCFLISFASLANSNSLLFATEATYPPFEFINSNGEAQGFDIDILKAMCMNMHKKCVFITQAWDSLIPGLKLGKFDVIFGAMAITSEREQQVNFTNSYYLNTGSLVGAKSSHLSNSTVWKNKIFGVQGATTFDNYLQAKYSSLVEIKRYPNIQEALLDLESGRVDAVLGDTPLIKEWLKKDKNSEVYELVGKPVEDAQFFGKGNGFAVKKGNTNLLKELNQALNAIQSDGTYKKIVQRYFGNE